MKTLQEIEQMQNEIEQAFTRVEFMLRANYDLEPSLRLLTLDLQQNNEVDELLARYYVDDVAWAWDNYLKEVSK